MINLEYFANIRFGYAYEPTRCVADPKSLWTYHSDGGVYEQAFGLNGGLADFWPDDVFYETVLMVLIYKKIEDQIDLFIKNYRKYLWLRRLRYVSLAISSEHIKITNQDQQHLRESRKAFDGWFDLFWKDCLRELIDAYQRAFHIDKITVFALARSEQRWTQIKSKFATYIELTTSTFP